MTVPGHRTSCINGITFLYFEESANFQQAIFRCNQEGATLGPIRGSQEFDTVDSLLSTLRVTGKAERVHIGLQSEGLGLEEAESDEIEFEKSLTEALFFSSSERNSRGIQFYTTGESPPWEDRVLTSAAASGASCVVIGSEGLLTFSDCLNTRSTGFICRKSCAIETTNCIGSTRFSIIHEPVNNQEALQICEERKGSLGPIFDDEEFNRVLRAANQAQSRDRQNAFYRIGLETRDPSIININIGQVLLTSKFGFSAEEDNDKLNFYHVDVGVFPWAIGKPSEVDINTKLCAYIDLGALITLNCLLVDQSCILPTNFVCREGCSLDRSNTVIEGRILVASFIDSSNQLSFSPHQVDDLCKQQVDEFNQGVSVDIFQDATILKTLTDIGVTKPNTAYSLGSSLNIGTENCRVLLNQVVVSDCSMVTEGFICTADFGEEPKTRAPAISPTVTSNPSKGSSTENFLEDSLPFMVASSFAIFALVALISYYSLLNKKLKSKNRNVLALTKAINQEDSQREINHLQA